MTTPAIQNIIKHIQMQNYITWFFCFSNAFKDYPNIEKVLVDNTKKMEIDKKFNIF